MEACDRGNRDEMRTKKDEEERQRRERWVGWENAQRNRNRIVRLDAEPRQRKQ